MKLEIVKYILDVNMLYNPAGSSVNCFWAYQHIMETLKGQNEYYNVQGVLLRQMEILF